MDVDYSSLLASVLAVYLSVYIYESSRVELVSRLIYHLPKLHYGGYSVRLTKPLHRLVAEPLFYHRTLAWSIPVYLSHYGHVSFKSNAMRMLALGLLTVFCPWLLVSGT